MRILITGASGFIGRWLVRRLVSEPEMDVVAAIRAEGPDRLEGAPTLRLEDFTDPRAISAAVERTQPNVIINLAAYGVSPDKRDPAAMFTVNAASPVWMMQAAAACGAAVVGAGSQSEYRIDAGTSVPVSENDPIGPDALYGASKAACWLGASAAARQLGGVYVHLRLFNVFGPGEAAHRLLPVLVRAARTGETAALSDGLQVRDFVYVEDVVEALAAAVRLAGRADPGFTEAVNICTGRAVSVRSFAETASEAFGMDRGKLAFGATARRPDDLPYVVGSPAKAEAMLNWAPRHTLEDGLARTAEFERAAAQETIQ